VHSAGAAALGESTSVSLPTAGEDDSYPELDALFADLGADADSEEWELGRPLAAAAS
jgi:hypothetical protein